jgi:uncharacterized ferritin-like protein (DUF455 family)
VTHTFDTVSAEAAAILATTDAEKKAMRAVNFGQAWRDAISLPLEPIAISERPARPKRPELLAPGKVPRRKINRGIKGRIALLHALAHIELNAIDLACDIIARFAHTNELPMNFTRDWVAVVSDEAKHFQLLNARLGDFDAAYGDLPAHDGLWEAAENTTEDIMARLAVVPLVLEARGLDVTPIMIAKLRAVEDDESADILEIIHRDEITHVAAGQRWFDYLCNARSIKPSATFKDLVRRYFKGDLKPPFNEKSRAAAGMPRSFYEQSAKPSLAQ